MKMTMSLKVFDILDDIRHHYHVKYKVWAKASELDQPRISEIRKLSWNAKTQNNEKVGRSFSLTKGIALINGLKTLIGGDMLRREIMKRLNETENQQERLCLLMFALDDSQQAQTEMFMKAFLDNETIDKKEDK